MRTSWRRTANQALKRLRPKLRNDAPPPASPPRVAVVGVGQELNGDDAAGVLAARALIKQLQANPEGTLVLKLLSLRHSHELPGPPFAAGREESFWNRGPIFVAPKPIPVSVMVIEAAHAPENCIGAIRRFAPDLVILVDAAEMGDPPGTIRWLDWRDDAGLGASTHTLSLSMMARYLAAELACDVGLIGIQSLDTSLGASISAPVRRAIRSVSSGLATLLLHTTGPTKLDRS